MKKREDVLDRWRQRGNYSYLLIGSLADGNDNIMTRLVVLWFGNISKQVWEVRRTKLLADGRQVGSNFAAMNEVYAKYFTLAPPARSTVQVARLPKDALVEIEVIAGL